MIVDSRPHQSFEKRRNHGHLYRLRLVSRLASYGHRLFQGGRQDALLQELTRDHESLRSVNQTTKNRDGRIK